MSEEARQLTPVEQLEAILFQFITLHDRMAEARQVFAKQCSDMDKVLRAFAAGVNDFKNSEEEVSENLLTALQAMSEKLTSNISEELFAAIKPTLQKDINALVVDLKRATQEARLTLNEQREKSWKDKLREPLVCVLGGILLGMGIIHFVATPPAAPLSSDDIDRLSAGDFLEKIWPHLPKKEQDHLNAIYKQVTAPPPPPSQTVQEREAYGLPADGGLPAPSQ